ncbi:MAG TPA: enoyl-CoA hydratase/isomerase family protein [Pseudonocardiaceae bacterium]|nr:enoyl-CoA hydratase/isomerase family protein [Pseudonocardiaceae bacterium]
MTTGTTRPGELVTVATHGPVAELVVGDGTKRNALTTNGWTAIERHIRALSTDDKVRAIVVRGRDGTFCAGSDLGEWVGASPEQVTQSFTSMESAFRAIEACPVPVVAEIEGIAAGAGCQLALACDLRFMADSAQIGMPIARLGILASPAFAARLVALAGPALASELLYTGQLLGAPSAARAGLINEHLPEKQLRARVEATLAKICAQPPPAVRAAKTAVSATLSPLRAASARNPSRAVSLPHFTTAIRAFFR